MFFRVFIKTFNDVILSCLFVCRNTKDGIAWYLVKWRDLPYDQATWEAEDAPIPDLNKYIEDYYDLRQVLFTCND
jgi:hypothetical protein